MLADELFNHTKVKTLDGEYAIPGKVVQNVEVAEIRPPDYVGGRSYELRTTIGVKFRCHPSNYDVAYKAALQTVVHKVYGALLSEIQEMRVAVWSQDPRDVLAICNRMEQKILEGDNKHV